MKTIRISSDLEKKLIASVKDSLSYKIYETDCPEEYEDDIMSQIELLRLLGRDAEADRYTEAYEAYLREEVAA